MPRSGAWRRLEKGAAVLAVLMALSCGGGEGPGAEPGDRPGSVGRLVIIGGGLQAENTEVYQAILDGRSGEGPVCVFPTASAEPQASMEAAVTRIDAVGGAGSAQGVFLTVDNPEDAGLPATVETIRSCSGFYFSGGVQTRIVRVFRPNGEDSPAFQALVERSEAGAVVSGSSAGAAIMSDPMIGGGSSVGALHLGIQREEDVEGVILVKGLGFLEKTLIDQHSLARGRWARMLVAVLGTEAYSFGAGIDENTALVVEGDSAWVVGEAGVAFFDTRDAVAHPQGSGAAGITLNLLGPGDRVDFGDGRILFTPDKPTVDPTVDPAVDPAVDPTGAASESLGSLADLDLFGRWGFLQFIAMTALSSDSVFTVSQEGFTFVFEKGPDFQARAWEGLGPGGTSRGLSVGPFIFSFSEAGSS